MTHKIYKITNKINNKIYIGQTINDIYFRFNQHSIAKSHIGNSIRKYGIENFNIELIEEFPVISIIKERKTLASIKEIKYISEYDSFKSGYNKTLGGEGTLGFKPIRTKEYRIKQSNKMNRRMSSGIKFSEHIAKLSNITKNTIQENGKTIQENSTIKMKITKNSEEWKKENLERINNKKSNTVKKNRNIDKFDKEIYEEKIKEECNLLNITREEWISLKRKEGQLKGTKSKLKKTRKFKLFNKNNIFECIMTLKEIKIISQSFIKTNKDNRLGSSKHSISRLIKKGNEKYIGWYVEEII